MSGPGRIRDMERRDNPEREERGSVFGGEDGREDERCWVGVSSWGMVDVDLEAGWKLGGVDCVVLIRDRVSTVGSRSWEVSQGLERRESRSSSRVGTSSNATDGLRVGEGVRRRRGVRDWSSSTGRNSRRGEVEEAPFP
jgi:hypothetical protein